MAERRPYVPAGPEEMAQRRRDVARLMLAGLTMGQIAEQLGLPVTRVQKVYGEVNEAWAREAEEDAKNARPQVIQRLRRDLAVLRNPLPLRDSRSGEVVEEPVKGPDGRPLRRGGKAVTRPVLAEVDWKAVAGHERLLADVEGTLRPTVIQVDVDATLRRSLVAVVASLDSQTIDQLVAEQRELEERAVRTELPLAPPHPVGPRKP
jgi:hypothetical protein